MSKLANEIRAIGFSNHGPEYVAGVIHGLELSAQLVEKREAERGWQPIETAPMHDELTAMLRKVLDGKWTTAEVEAIIKKAESI